MSDQGITRKPAVPGRRFIACDLDGTLAHYDRYRGRNHIGDPIPAMVQRVKDWIAKGDVVCIFTSRVADDRRPDHNAVLNMIHAWTEKHIGERLYVTATKEPYFSAYYDDTAVGVIPNTGELRSHPL